MKRVRRPAKMRHLRCEWTLLNMLRARQRFIDAFPGLEVVGAHMPYKGRIATIDYRRVVGQPAAHGAPYGP